MAFAKKFMRVPAVASMCRVLTLLVAGIGVAAALAGTLLTAAAAAAPRLTEADRETIWRNGLREALLTIVIAIVVATPPYIVARRARLKNDDAA